MFSWKNTKEKEFYNITCSDRNSLKIMKFLVQNKIIITYGLTLVNLIIIVLFSLLGTTGKTQRVAFDDNVFSTIEAMDQILDDINSTEAEVNSFILTSENGHIKNYLHKRKPLEEKLAYLENRFKNQPNQQKKFQHLKRLINKRISTLETSIQLMKKEGILKASEYLQKNTREKSLAQIRWLQEDLINGQKASMKLKQKKLTFSIKSREYIIISASIASLLISMIAIGTIVIDLHEKREREKYLEAVNQNKNRFFSLISHDLKGPAHNIIGISEILLKDKDLAQEEKQTFLSYLNTSAKKNFILLENLLEWSQIQMGTLHLNQEKCALEQMTTETLALTEESIRKKNLTIKNNIAQGTFVYADINSIKAVIRNLLSNAIKFTPPDGEIDISAEKVDKTVLFSLKDSGIGMDSRTLEALFTSNKIASRHGTEGEVGSGLGLLLCKEFIEKNKGTIWVESQEGKGTCFKFILPLAV